MKYKSPILEQEYKALHPQLRTVMEQLETFSAENGLPEPVATHIRRTRKGQEDIYWRSVLAANPSMTEAQARTAASKRFSWHLVNCAIDLRDYIYTKQQVTKLLAWLRQRCPAPTFEVLYHDVGRGQHLHVGIRDHEYASTQVIR